MSCDDDENVGPSASPRRQSGAVDTEWTSLHVCLPGAPPPAAHLSHFWRDMEASGVNGELKLNVPVLLIAACVRSGDGGAEAYWGSCVAHGPDSRLDILLLL